MRALESPPHFIDFAEVQILARDLGFASLGFVDVSEVSVAPAARDLKAWVEAGYHGDMGYMLARAEQRAKPSLLLENVRSAIVVSLDYRPQDPAWLEQAWRRLDTAEQAYVSCYAVGRDYHKIMRSRLQKLADALCRRYQSFSYRAFCDSAPVMELPLARRAGLGWRGKHTLLLNREQGSMFFIACLYTSLSLREQVPATNQANLPSEHCGTCTKCLEICPTQAIIAPHKLDARRCISYLTIESRDGIAMEFRAAIGNRIYGCDDCQLVCPWNKFAQAPVHAQVSQELAPRSGMESASLLELWAWDEQVFLRNTEGSAIRRIGFWRWRRNLLIAMGNALRTLSEGAASSDGGSDHLKHSQIQQALHAALSDPELMSDAVLAEHLAWAIDQGSSSP
jgi:epoxyqueuosine reductase